MNLVVYKERLEAAIVAVDRVISISPRGMYLKIMEYYVNELT